MLARLEQALGCADLTKQMVLIPGQSSVRKDPPEAINLVVGYNDSPHSHTALDLTLWIAHQTRLATRRTVRVQVVYVVDLEQERKKEQERKLSTLTFTPIGRSKELRTSVPLYVSDLTRASNVRVSKAEASGLECSADARLEAIELDSLDWLTPSTTFVGKSAASASSAVCRTKKSAQDSVGVVESAVSSSTDWQIRQFEQADRILWQARHLATEWRGSLETHLRFGPIAQELCNVAQQESATVLILGCSSTEHPIVKALGNDLPCPVLGTPSRLCKV
jgi:nucleotide-binding universal stress UspA family protein